MKCINCGISIPELPEDATREEILCNMYYEEEGERINPEDN